MDLGDLPVPGSALTNSFNDTVLQWHISEQNSFHCRSFQKAFQNLDKPLKAETFLQCYDAATECMVSGFIFSTYLGESYQPRRQFLDRKP
jgi:hypothetical protein